MDARIRWYISAAVIIWEQWSNVSVAPKALVYKESYFIHSLTHAMKFVVLFPVRSALTCFWPQTVSKSTDSTPS